MQATGDYFVTASADKTWGFHHLEQGTTLAQIQGEQGNHLRQYIFISIAIFVFLSICPFPISFHGIYYISISGEWMIIYYLKCPNTPASFSPTLFYPILFHYISIPLG